MATSTMPEWITERLGPNKVGIQCPRKDCKNKAVVNERKWFVGRSDTKRVDTRMCTFCSRAAWLPGMKPKPE